MTPPPNTAIDPTARLGANVQVGSFTTIGPDVTIGDDTMIGPNVLIERGTVIGSRCQIFHGASIGGDPQIFDFEDVPSTVTIGDDTVIREFVTVHRGGKENAVTRIGNHCMLMAYCHVAHDCVLEDQVIVANGVNLSGHVIVEEFAFISGLVGVHQYVRIGRHAMIGGFTGLRKDALPYSLNQGFPSELLSINAVGLKRRNFKPAVRSALKQAIKWIKDPELNTTQALEKIEAEIEMHDEIRYLINFIRTSDRGITK